MSLHDGSGEQTPEQQHLTMRVAAVPDAIEEVMDRAGALWDDAGVAVQDRFRFETALVEVLGNIVEHAFRVGTDDDTDDDTDDEDAAAAGAAAEPELPGDPRRSIDVELSVTPAEIVGRLSDDGVPVALDLDDVEMPDAEAESGRGLALAGAVLDGFSHAREGDINLWTLTCRRTVA